MHNYLSIIVGLSFIGVLQAQHQIDESVATIEKNNKTILTAKQHMSAKSLELNTGLSLPDPTIEADYMIGRPVEGGNQFDFVAVQGFDFPSTYFRKRNLADNQSKVLEYEYQMIRQNTLLDAKVACIEKVFFNKQQELLRKRKDQAKRMLDSYQLKFNEGDIGVLELNKAKVSWLGIEVDYMDAKASVKKQSDELTALNGGMELALSDTVFPIVPTVPLFENLEQDIEANDPGLKVLDQQTNVNQSMLKVNKAMALPTFQAGYHYQSVLGQTFNGVHFGLSIPLWEHKNKIKASKAIIMHGDQYIAEHRNEHYYEVKQLYENGRKLYHEFR